MSRTCLPNVSDKARVARCVGRCPQSAEKLIGPRYRPSLSEVELHVKQQLLLVNIRNTFQEWCANCNYSWRAQHYRGQLYDNVMSPISIIVTFPCLELTAHLTNLFFSLGKWSLKWNCTKMRRNLGSWWLDIISYCPAPRQFNFRVKTA